MCAAQVLQTRPRRQEPLDALPICQVWLAAIIRASVVTIVCDLGSTSDDGRRQRFVLIMRMRRAMPKYLVYKGITGIDT